MTKIIAQTASIPSVRRIGDSRKASRIDLKSKSKSISNNLIPYAALDREFFDPLKNGSWRQGQLKVIKPGKKKGLAEREGFEPSEQFPVHRFSKPAL
jgi:hypothetical protein